LILIVVFAVAVGHGPAQSLASASPPQTQMFDKPTTAHVVALNLNVRTGPGSAFPLATPDALPNGAEITVYGQAQSADGDQWDYVRVANGANGYVNAKFLAETSSVASAAPTPTPAPSAQAAPSSTVICGREVSYVVDVAGTAEAFKPFLGVWPDQAWNSRICAGFVVSSVDGDGTAHLIYVYGPRSGAPIDWKAQTPAALISNGQLAFTDEDGGTYTFRLDQPDVLRGHFLSRDGKLILDAMFTRDMSSAPR
jgi:hypothetical protein